MIQNTIKLESLQGFCNWALSPHPLHLLQSSVLHGHTVDLESVLSNPSPSPRLKSCTHHRLCHQIMTYWEVYSPSLCNTEIL